MFITVEMLKTADVCATARSRFEDLFPDGVEVTRELCLQHASAFDWDWAAENLLPKSAWDVYDAAVEPALDVYDAAVKSAWDAYDAADKSARDTYYAAIKPAWDAYNAAMAVAFWEASR